MMPGKARKFVRVTKFLLAGVTLFCVSWIACVNQWHPVIRWSGGTAGGGRGLSTMRTIVAYSEGKLAEMERPSPVTCDTLPTFPEIPHINRSWSPDVKQQPWQRVAGTKVSLFAAYYDERSPQRYVRILATFHGRNFSAEDTLFCQTRSLSPYDESVEVVTARPLEIWWHEWDATSMEVDTPLLLSCPLTEPLYDPSIVSVVTQPCDDPTNAFPLYPNKITTKTKRNFTICVKDMNFDKDISQTVIEWIETNKVLGIDKIDMYIDNVNQETENVLRHYRNTGFVRLFNVPITHNKDRSLWQRRRDHIITYNDCLYRNIQESEFIIPLDVDEIILPKKAESLPELLSRLVTRGWNMKKNSAIMIRNVFFFDFMQGINKYKKRILQSETKMYEKRDDVRIKESDNLDVGQIVLEDDPSNVSNAVIDIRDINKVNHKTSCGLEIPVPKLARHVVSSAIVSPIGYYTKSLMVTKKVLTAFNHYPLANLGDAGFAGWAAPFSEVQLNHYKETCNSTMVAECARYGHRAKVDISALRFHNRLLKELDETFCNGINHS